MVSFSLPYLKQKQQDPQTCAYKVLFIIKKYERASLYIKVLRSKFDHWSDIIWMFFVWRWRVIVLMGQNILPDKIVVNCRKKWKIKAAHLTKFAYEWIYSQFFFALMNVVFNEQKVKVLKNWNLKRLKLTLTYCKWKKNVGFFVFHKILNFLNDFFFSEKKLSIFFGDYQTKLMTHFWLNSDQNWKHL